MKFRSVTLPRAPIRSFGQDLVQSFIALREKPTAADCVFHYTSVESFFKIVASQAFWATNTFYLNDTQELLFSMNIVLDCMLHSTLDQSKKKILGPILYKYLCTHAPSDLYVVSFSESVDQLSQWRAYGPSGGLAIGISKANLAAFCEKRGATLARVVYDPDEQKALVDEFLTKLMEEFDYSRAGDANYTTEIFDRLLLPQFLGVAPRLKHPAFFEECEWRIIMEPNHSSSVKFRSNGGRIVPYLELDLREYSHENADGPCWFPQIWLGPSHNSFESEVEMIQSYLGAQGLETHGLYKSRIPYQSQ